MLTKTGIFEFQYLQSSFSDKFSRLIRETDRILPNFGVKIAILFVAPNQILQGDILANQNGSPSYEKFLRNLGEMVDLSVHKKYTGGLDLETFSSGKHAIYSHQNFEEIIFHIATFMPTVLGDRQQLNKKKHIGNDFVHIVWSEANNDYDWGTITSHFNDVHVIIYPLPNGLFRLCIHRKSSDERTIPTFGPILDGMVVNENILAPLVKQTVLFANRNCRKLSKGYSTPYHQRLLLIREIVETAMKAANLKSLANRNQTWSRIRADEYIQRESSSILTLSNPPIPTSPSRITPPPMMKKSQSVESLNEVTMKRDRSYSRTFFNSRRGGGGGVLNRKSSIAALAGYIDITKYRTMKARTVSDASPLTSIFTPPNKADITKPSSPHTSPKLSPKCSPTSLQRPTADKNNKNHNKGTNNNPAKTEGPVKSVRKTVDSTKLESRKSKTMSKLMMLKQKWNISQKPPSYPPPPSPQGMGGTNSDSLRPSPSSRRI